MPEVSRFFGISIRMYFDDHDPPHFHAIYAGAEIEVGIEPLRDYPKTGARRGWPGLERSETPEKPVRGFPWA